MSFPSVEFHPEAEDEIVSAFEWYAERSETAAATFVSHLEDAMDLVVESPRRWASYLHGTRRFIMKRFPFLIVYRIKSDEMIQIVAVAHGNRKPGYWRDRVDR